MPHITTAMHNSVRRRLGESMVNSLLGRRSITQDVTNSFSSWGNCMNADYCKWPVIAGIVIASLIVLSILTCIGRVCCCGASCCCACFSFLSCCDCCGDSCAGKKDKPHKHLDDPFTNGHAAHRGYQAPPPMMGGALPPPLTAPFPASGHAAGTLMPLASKRPEPTQYAQFEVGKNGLYVEPKTVELHEDALPPMPSWDGAAKKHVEDEKNAVELQLLEPASGQKMSLTADAATAGTSGPPSPVEGLGNRAGKNGYMGIAGDNYGQNRTAYSVRHASPAPGMAGQGRGGFGGKPPGGYDGHGQARGFGQDQYGQSRPGGYEAQGRGYDTLPQEGYANGNGFGTAAAGYGPRKPPLRQYANDQYSTNGRSPPNRQYTGDSSRAMTPGRQYSDQSYGSDNFAQKAPPRGPSRGPDPNGGYNNGPIPRGPSRGPGPNDGYNNIPIPRGPSRGPSPNDAFNQAPLPRGPSRGPSGGPVNTGAPAPNHNSGFDFGIGSIRPSPPPQQRFSPPHQSSFAAELPAYDVQQGYFDNAGTTVRRTPPPLETAYPGYRPYAPANKTQGTPSALTPGGREEPERWDPVREY